MKFSPANPERPAREEFISEDENFKLIVDNSASRYSRYVISVERISTFPGFGLGQTKREAMEKARESMEKAVVVLRERICQLNAMIEEEIATETMEPKTGGFTEVPAAQFAAYKAASEAPVASPSRLNQQEKTDEVD